MSDFIVIIPARMNSSRLPGKMLMDIAGKPMVQYAFEAAKTAGAKKIIIAVDDERLEKACQQFGATVCMTSRQHETGTERIAEVVKKHNIGTNEIIVGLQADEPLLPPRLIKTLADNLALHARCKMATLAAPLTHSEDLFNPNVVKVQLDYQDCAMTFTRAAVPWDRDQFRKTTLPADITLASNAYYRHIGLYAYRAGFLETYVNLPQNNYEKLESLEQLRVLYQGHKIHVDVIHDTIPPGVDTKEDLERVRAMMSEARPGVSEARPEGCA